MRKNQQIVCRWLLNRFPEHFTPLERDKDNYKLIITPDNSRLIVPKDICVWNVDSRTYRGRGKYLFASRTDGNPVFDNAYLFCISFRKKYDKVIENLFDCPWFGLGISSRFFHKIISPERNANPAESPHVVYMNLSIRHPLDRGS